MTDFVVPALPLASLAIAVSRGLRGHGVNQIQALLREFGKGDK